MMRWADKDGDGKVFFSFLVYLRLASLFGKVFFLLFFSFKTCKLVWQGVFLLFFSFETCKLVWQVTQFFEGGAEGILVNDVSQRQRNSHKVNNISVYSTWHKYQNITNTTSAKSILFENNWLVNVFWLVCKGRVCNLTSKVFMNCISGVHPQKKGGDLGLGSHEIQLCWQRKEPKTKHWQINDDT